MLRWERQRKGQLRRTNGRTDGTRERIIRLLSSQPLTIEAMADSLGLTKNAVRSQISLLQREGILGPSGTAKGSRRPAVIYGLFEGADDGLSRAYPSLVYNLVRTLSRSLPGRDFEAIMGETGRALASTAPRAKGEALERARTAITFLESLGSAPELTEEEGSLVISSDGCPIGMAVSADERSCLSIEAMLGELTGLKVTRACRHDAAHRCRFVLTQ
jgi:predicted ArsR family transcriptional regulator